MHFTNTLASATTRPVATGMLYLPIVFVLIALIFDFLTAWILTIPCSAFMAAIADGQG